MAGQKKVTGMAAGATAKPKRPWTERNGPILTPEEAAEYLGVTEKFARRLFYERKLRGLKFNSQLRFHIDDLKAYIADAPTDPQPKGAAAIPLRRRTTRRQSAP